MTERQNVQTEYKWVASHDDEPRGRPWYIETDENVTPKPERARLYDSPSDVPDDCSTPVRVRVETWEEEGEERMWDGDGDPDAFRMAYLGADPTPRLEPTERRYPAPLTHAEAKKALKEWNAANPTDVTVALTAIPVRIPTETKRKVTLDPEPTETGCRCHDALLRLWVFREVGPSDWAWNEAERALADCDCKSRETP